MILYLVLYELNLRNSLDDSLANIGTPNNIVISNLTDNYAEISFTTQNDVTVVLTYNLENSESKITAQNYTRQTPESVGKLHHFKLNNLLPSKKYTYTININGVNIDSLSKSLTTFTTLPRRNPTTLVTPSPLLISLPSDGEGILYMNKLDSSGNVDSELTTVSTRSNSSNITIDKNQFRNLQNNIYEIKKDDILRLVFTDINGKTFYAYRIFNDDRRFLRSAFVESVDFDFYKKMNLAINQRNIETNQQNDTNNQNQFSRTEQSNNNNVTNVSDSNKTTDTTRSVTQPINNTIKTVKDPPNSVNTTTNYNQTTTDELYGQIRQIPYTADPNTIRNIFSFVIGIFFLYLPFKIKQVIKSD